jgi:hypothetical protein
MEDKGRFTRNGATRGELGGAFASRRMTMVCLRVEDDKKMNDKNMIDGE